MSNGTERLSGANVGWQPTAAMISCRYNDTSVIRGPATMKAGWLNSNEAEQLTAV